MRESYRVIAPDRYMSTRFIDDVVTIRCGGHVVIDTDHALGLLEGDLPEVTYVPLDEIFGATLQASGMAYHCRWKGDAKFYDVQLTDGEIMFNGAWAYPDAPDEVAPLRKLVAFDTAQFTTQFNEQFRTKTEV